MDDTYTVQTRLISLRRLRGSHFSENMASVIAEIIDGYSIVSKLGFFVLNNVKSNDTCVEEFLAIVRKDILLRNRSTR
jgi:hypothetical protein